MTGPRVLKLQRLLLWHSSRPIGHQETAAPWRRAPEITKRLKSRSRYADPRIVIEELPNHDELAAELARLEQAERELSNERAHVHVRMDVGLPEMTARHERQASADRLSLHRRIERQLSDRRLKLHKRIDFLRAELADSPKRFES